MSLPGVSPLTATASLPPTLLPSPSYLSKLALEYVRTVDKNPWIPHSPHSKQRAFLLLSDVREAMFGGAARGGKSEALLMAAAQYLNVPGYAALILRRNFPDLKQSEGLIPRSLEWWYGKEGADWNSQDRQWTFACKGGGTSLIRFGYCDTEKDVYQYQGSAYHCVCWDELTQFTPVQYRYLFSRQSKPPDGPLAAVPLRVRSASNPGGVGHDWVKKRFVNPKTRRRGAAFVPSRVEDNPTVDYDEYVESLSFLDPVTRAQLLVGDWDAVAGGRFKSEWFKEFRRYGTGYRFTNPDESYRYVEHLLFTFQTCDPAASEKRTADYTVLSTWGVTPRWELLWLSCERWQKEIPDLPPLILQSYQRWKPKFVAIERVGANAAVFQLCQRLPMVVKPLDPLGLDKLVRATPAMNLAASGRLYFPESAAWLDDAQGELLRFTGDPKQDAHDDIVDTLSYAAASFSETDGDARKQRPQVRSSW